MIVRKSPAELEKMRRSGLLVHEILHKLAGMVQVGVSTLDLEVEAEKMIRDAGAGRRSRAITRSRRGQSIRLCCVRR